MNPIVQFTKAHPLIWRVFVASAPSNNRQNERLAAVVEKYVPVDIEATSQAFCGFFADRPFTGQNVGYPALRCAIAQIFLMETVLFH